MNLKNLVCKDCEFIGTMRMGNCRWSICKHRNILKTFDPGRITDSTGWPSWCPLRPDNDMTTIGEAVTVSLDMETDGDD